jgi:MFS family permease
MTASATAKPADAAPNILPFAVMCVGMFVALLDIQIVASSLQDIGGGLSAAQDDISWVQTAYLIAEIIVIPLSGWLTRVFSTRWLFAASAAGFTIASLLCGIAWNIESMIVFRALQGMLGASMIPTVFTSSFHYFPGPRRVYSAAVVGTIASVAPVLGPVIGGWITDTLDWHWLFYVNLVPGLLVAVTVPLLVKIDRPDLSLLKGADYPGMIFKRKSRRCQRGSPEKPSGFPPHRPAAQYKWQATMCCEATSLWTGASPAHCGMAYGQRGWKRQPEDGSSALGTSPVMVSFSCLSSGCDGKAAVNRVCV